MPKQSLLEFLEAERKRTLADVWKFHKEQPYCDTVHTQAEINGAPIPAVYTVTLHYPHAPGDTVITNVPPEDIRSLVEYYQAHGARIIEIR